MNQETLSVAGVVISAVNLLALLTIAFGGGKWVGRVDQRLKHLEEHIERRARP